MTEAGQAAYPGVPRQCPTRCGNYSEPGLQNNTDKARVEMDDKQRSVAVESCRKKRQQLQSQEAENDKVRLQISVLLVTTGVGWDALLGITTISPRFLISVAFHS